MISLLRTIRRNGSMRSRGATVSLPRMQVAEREVEQEQAEPVMLDLTRLFAQYKVILHNGQVTHV